VPGFHGEIGVLPVGDGLPSGVQDRLKGFLRQVAIDGFHLYAVDSGADRVTRIDGVGWLCRVDTDGLGEQRRYAEEKKTERTKSFPE
jgi:hypothetical protein